MVHAQDHTSACPSWQPQHRSTSTPVIGRTVGASHTPRTLAHTADEEISYLLGGYGYFDISDYQEVRTRAASPEPPFNVNASRREIGRKLRLAEY